MLVVWNFFKFLTDKILMIALCLQNREYLEKYARMCYEILRTSYGTNSTTCALKEVKKATFMCSQYSLEVQVVATIRIKYKEF